MIVPNAAAPEVVVAWLRYGRPEDGEDVGLSEIGWMVMPEFQGRGELFTPSLGCPTPRPTRSAAPSGSLVGERNVSFAGRELRTNHWQIDPSTDLAWPRASQLHPEADIRRKGSSDRGLGGPMSRRSDRAVTRSRVR
jgi:hypothetical protein